MQTATTYVDTTSIVHAQPSDGIRTATVRDQNRVAAVLTQAFTGDLPMRWVYPDAEQYQRHFPNFVRAFGGSAVDFGTAYYIDGFSGCALWLPPGQEPDEVALIEFIEYSVPRDRHNEVFAVFEAMGKAHPTELHWYLPLIGVDVAFRGCGIGSALLRRTLDVCDRVGLPAYLEATSPRNIPLYERHGFRRLQSLQVGSCPPITPMWREPV